MNSFTFIALAIGMVCALAQDGARTPVTCSEVLTSSDCTEVSPKSSLYTDYECGWGEDIDLCNTENCCGEGNFCIPVYIGDGFCDAGNNNADCGNYDGGDCCECTCFDGDFMCGSNGFDCKAPNACGVDDVDDAGDVDDFTDDYGYGGYGGYGSGELSCFVFTIANGICDPNNNNADCGNYDGGDCCESTCMDSEFTCGSMFGFDCRDPSASDVGELPMGDVGELPMGPCDTPCLENCNLDWICTSS